MRRLRDMLDSADPWVAGLARLIRTADDLEPPRGALSRVREGLVRHARSEPAAPRRVTGRSVAISNLRPWVARDRHDAIIGQYQLTGVIGRGRLGTVYAARHVRLGRPAALKVILPQRSVDPDAAQRFFQEARAATAIRHDGILEIYDFGWTAAGLAFIVMEPLDGETLAQRLTRGPLPWRAAIGIVRQIADALAAAHAVGIVHRDLRPENVFVTRDPEVPGGERIKLLDFGIAKLASGESLADTAVIHGAPAYMAPEQARTPEVDHRADLHALGSILFVLCSGHPPLAGAGSGDVIATQLSTTVPTLAALGVDVPDAVERLVQRLLAKSPAQRVQNTEEVIRAIDAIVAGDVIDASAPGRGGAEAPIASELCLHTHTSWPPGPLTASSAIDLPSAAGLHSNTSRSNAAGARGSARLPAWRHCLGGLIVAAAVAVIAVVAITAGEPADRSAPTLESPSGSPFAPAPPSAADSGPAPATALSSAVAAVSTAGAPPSAAGGAGSSQAASGAPRPTDDGDAPAVDPGRGTAAPRDDAPDPRRAAPTRTPAPQTGMRSQIEISIDSIPSGALVLLHGTVLGTTPFRGTLPHRASAVALVVRLAGHVDQSVIIHPQGAVTVRVSLAPVAPPHVQVPGHDDSVNPFNSVNPFH
jgi:serine/threonine-protein kinase